MVPFKNEFPLKLSFSGQPGQKACASLRADGLQMEMSLFLPTNGSAQISREMNAFFSPLLQIHDRKIEGCLK